MRTRGPFLEPELREHLDEHLAQSDGHMRVNLLQYPQIIHLSGIFHYKPSILGIPHLWKPPFKLPFSIATFHRGLSDKRSSPSTPRLLLQWLCPGVDTVFCFTKWEPPIIAGPSYSKNYGL